jgi:hypothetical protein
MRKLKLTFDDLNVASFTTSRCGESRGTAYAHADTAFADTAYVVNPLDADTTIAPDDGDTTIAADTTLAPR